VISVAGLAVVVFAGCAVWECVAGVAVCVDEDVVVGAGEAGCGIRAAGFTWFCARLANALGEVVSWVTLKTTSFGDGNAVGQV